MRYDLDMSVTSIAEALDLPQTRVQQLHTRALELIRKMIARLT